MGLDHKDTHCITPGDPGASAGSSVGRVRVQKVLRLLPTQLVGEARSWHWCWITDSKAICFSLVAGPRSPEMVSDCWWGRWLVPDSFGYGIWGVPKLVLAC